MTIAQAIEQASLAKPGGLSRSRCVRWLARVDRAVFEQLIATHENGAIDAFAGYDPDDDSGADGVTLLVPEPYSGLYVHYVCAQQDLLNQDFDLYANNAALYNRAWTEYAAAYNRSHLPLRRAALHTTGG